MLLKSNFPSFCKSNLKCVKRHLVTVYRIEPIIILTNSFLGILFRISLFFCPLSIMHKRTSSCICKSLNTSLAKTLSFWKMDSEKKLRSSLKMSDTIICDKSGVLIYLARLFFYAQGSAGKHTHKQTAHRHKQQQRQPDTVVGQQRL